MPRRKKRSPHGGDDDGDRVVMVCLMSRRIPRHAAVLSFVLSVTLAGTAGIAAGPLLIDDFAKGLSAGWEEDFQVG